MNSIKSLIKEGEHQQQDFKFRIDDSKKIARTICAFANTDGGRLLIGVKDNGKITGIDPNEEIHMIDAAAEINCSPAVKFESKVWQEELRLVLEINIPKSEPGSVMAKDEEGKWKVYVRREDHTLLANKILLEVWKQQKRKINRPEKFGAEETALLAVINENESLTLSQIYKHSTLKKSRVDQLLVTFICWELVEMIMDQSGTTYRTAQGV